MKEIKNIGFEGFYIFRGKACANSCFIENVGHAKQFVTYMNFYLKGYLKVYDYCLSKDGWELAVKLADKESILAKTDASHIDKINSDDELCWRIVSERVRLFLSTYVRVTNRSRGRTGTLVHNSYGRLHFTKLKNAIQYLNDMRQQRFKYYEEGAKYAGLEEHYEIDAIGSVFLSSRAGTRRKIFGEKKVDVLYYKAITSLVLQEAVKFTKSIHTYTKAPKTSKIQLKL